MRAKLITCGLLGATVFVSCHPGTRDTLCGIVFAAAEPGQVGARGHADLACTQCHQSWNGLARQVDAGVARRDMEQACLQCHAAREVPHARDTSAGGCVECHGEHQAAALYKTDQTPHLISAASCASARCHNEPQRETGAGPAGWPKAAEYTIWITKDKHAKAYETLLSDRSKQIVKRLGGAGSAHKDQQCLNCHVYPSLDEEAQKTYYFADGVSCEVCHGPAQKWLAVHFKNEWKRKSQTEKAEYGFGETKAIGPRAAGCAVCHVGKQAMEVDHELIAAGHPALTGYKFEDYMAKMPRHWGPAGQPNEKDQAAGRRATAQAMLELLESRIVQRQGQADFAEYACAACHHDLGNKDYQLQTGPGTGRKLGVLPWVNRFDGILPRERTRGLHEIMEREPWAGVAKKRREIEALQKMLDATP
jgi:hypothetical protein